jgi:hypothetical protein
VLFQRLVPMTLHSDLLFPLLVVLSLSVFSICLKYLELTGRSVESMDNPCRFRRSMLLWVSHLPGWSIEKAEPCLSFRVKRQM